MITPFFNLSRLYAKEKSSENQLLTLKSAASAQPTESRRRDCTLLVTYGRRRAVNIECVCVCERHEEKKKCAGCV